MPRADPPEESEPPRARGDGVASGLSVALFSLSHAIAGIAVPLLMVRAGYEVAEVGIVIAMAAVAQMATRLSLGALMRRLPDKVFVVASGALISISCGIVVVSSGWAAVIVSQLLQGVARAFFWTGTQTHAVRTSDSSVGALAKINLVAGFGLLGGPVLAGLLSEHSAQLALLVGAVAGACAVVPALLLVRLAPFGPRTSDRRRGGIWRRPGVYEACWGSATSGAWRGLLGSYVPVVLEEARQSSSTIGVLVSVTNAASLVGSVLVGRVTGSRIRWSLILGTIATGVGIAAVGPVASSAVLAGAALMLSGVGAGALQTVSPALAADSTGSEERGEAIASTGTFRAGTLLLAPVGVAGLVVVSPLSVALVVSGLLMVLPVAVNSRNNTGGRK
ncbi:MFS transporter [Nocardiopsis oceani]